MVVKETFLRLTAAVRINLNVEINKRDVKFFEYVDKSRPSVSQDALRPQRPPLLRRLAASK
jgi:hypothetical protein